MSVSKEEIGEAKVVATGGLANTVVPHCKNDIILDDELLLKGLMIIYNKTFNFNKFPTCRIAEYAQNINIV